MPRTVFTLVWCAGLCSCLLSAAGDETGWARFRGPDGSGVANNQNIPVTFSDESILWKTPIAGLGHSSPVVCKNHLFLQSSSISGDQRMLLCIDAKTGKQNWSRSLPAMKSTKHASNTLASSTPVTDGDAVYAAFWDGETSLWRHITSKAIFCGVKISVVARPSRRRRVAHPLQGQGDLLQRHEPDG